MSGKPVQNILEEEIENINYRKKGMNGSYVMKSEKDLKNMHQVVHKSLEMKGLKTTQLFLELMGELGKEERNHALIQQFRNKHLKIIQEVNEEKRISFCPDDRVAKVGEKGTAIVWISPKGSITEYSRDSENKDNLVPGRVSYYVTVDKELVEIQPQLTTDESSSSSGNGLSNVMTDPQQGASSQENETSYGLDAGFFNISDY